MFGGQAGLKHSEVIWSGTDAVEIKFAVAPERERQQSDQVSSTLKDAPDELSKNVPSSMNQLKKLHGNKVSQSSCAHSGRQTYSDINQLA